MQIILARTQGFCAGVARAVKIVNQALVKYGTPLYVFHEIVHNTHVIHDFESRGAVFVNDISAIPTGSHVIFSAHGVSPQIIEQARQRGLKSIDATCPLVKRIHQQAIGFSERGIPVILIGNKQHQEIIGTSGYIRPELLSFIHNRKDIAHLSWDADQPVAYLTQTTLSVDDTRQMITELKRKYRRLMAPGQDNICYATQRRQDAIRELASMVEIIIVCGSPTSSNSKRLRETGERWGIPSYLIDDAEELDISLLGGHENIGISSGASVPYSVVEALIQRIKNHWPDATIRHLESSQHPMVFPIPKI